jgi:DNA-binding transcriptional regulator of glucitol operon
LARRTSIFVLLVALVSVFALTGCMTTSYPVMGMWTQDVRVPVDGRIATGPKEGKACVTTYAGVYAFGDASVERAAKNGGITKVQSVEALVNARIVIGSYCTVVRGS